MIKLILILLLCNSIIVVSAQDDLQSDKAKGILDKVSARTKTYKTIRAEFTFTLYNQQENITETTEGTVYIKGEKYKLLLMGAETYFDGKNKCSYIVDANEVNITDPADEEESILTNPQDIFTVYQEGFKYKFVREKFEKARPLYEIDLFPVVPGEKEFSRIKLLIDKQKLQLFTVKYFGKDGNIYIIEIQKFQHDLEINDSVFVFDKSKHPDVEVIDLRE